MSGQGFENGHSVQTVDPDIAGEIDEKRIAELESELAVLKGEEGFKPLTIQAALASKADAWRWFSIFCWTPENSCEERRTAKEAAIRFVSLSILLQPQLFEGGTSYQKLAKELGVSRAELSKAALKLSDGAGLQFRGQRKKETRDKNAIARIKQHTKQRAEKNESRQSFFRILGRCVDQARARNSVGAC